MKNGTIFEDYDENLFWVESFRISQLGDHRLHRCLTLQWPPMNKPKNSMVSLFWNLSQFFIKYQKIVDHHPIQSFYGGRNQF